MVFHDLSMMIQFEKVGSMRQRLPGSQWMDGYSEAERELKDQIDCMEGELGVGSRASCSAPMREVC